MRLRRNAKIDLLRQVPLFAECSQKELGLVATSTDEIAQPDGAVLVEEGQRGREFFVIVAGTASVTRGGSRLSALGPGDFFGEISLVTDVPRTATVTATSPIRLLVMTRPAFRHLLDETPSIQGKVLLALARRLAPTAI